MPGEREPIRTPPYTDILGAYDRLVTGYLADPTPAQLQRVLTQHDRLLQELAKPGRFDLGFVVQTPGAQDAMATAFHTPIEFLLRHKQGDWGELESEDLQENEDSVRRGSRLFSAYRMRTDTKLWVITEWDRSVTTLLLPNEY